MSSSLSEQAPALGGSLGQLVQSLLDGGIVLTPLERPAVEDDGALRLAGESQDAPRLLEVGRIHRLELAGVLDGRHGLRQPVGLLRAGHGEVLPGLRVPGLGLGGAVEVVRRVEKALLLVGFDAPLEIDAAHLARIGLARPRQLAVVPPPALGVGEHVEGLRDLLELDLGGLFLGAPETVGMTQPGKLPETFADLVLGGIARQCEDGVEVPGHIDASYCCLILYKRSAVERTASGMFLSRARSRRSRTAIRLISFMEIGSGVLGFFTSAFATLYRETHSRFLEIASRISSATDRLLAICSTSCSGRLLLSSAERATWVLLSRSRKPRSTRPAPRESFRRAGTGNMRIWPSERPVWSSTSPSTGRARLIAARVMARSSSSISSMAAGVGPAVPPRSRGNRCWRYSAIRRWVYEESCGLLSRASRIVGSSRIASWRRIRTSCRS